MTLTYDSINRLASSVATGSSIHNLTFSYDRYGNMTCVTNQNTNGPCPNYTFNASTNQVTNAGFTYDPAGNLTADGTGTGTHTYQWDAENRLKSIDNGSTATYTYNALGQRVEKLVGTTYTEYAYHAGGEELGENNRAGWTIRVIPFAGRHLAHYNDPSGTEATYFMHGNRLGATSQATDYSGAVSQDQLFYPWGQQWQTVGSSQEMRFAQLGHRDAIETGLDPTRFRMFSSAQGRWLSKDPKAGRISSPQTLNRYVYVRNNPPNFIDPRGTNGGDRGDGGFFGPDDRCDLAPDSDTNCMEGPIFGGGYFIGFPTRICSCWGINVTPVFYGCAFSCTCDDGTEGIALKTIQSCRVACGRPSMIQCPLWIEVTVDVIFGIGGPEGVHLTVEG